MGCDIHVYPEYYYDNEPEQEKIFIHSIGNYYLGRNYVLFGCLAGVRSCHPGVVSPRGVPDNMGWDAEMAYYLTAIPDEDMQGRDEYENNIISHSKAKAISKEGTYPILNTSNKHWKIRNPDWHSSSWLTLEELYKVRRYYIEEQLCELPKKKQQKFRKILKSCKTDKELLNHRFDELECVNLNGLIGMLMLMEHTDPKVKTRIVFWFDS